jgi:2-dehydropantoate 2-reductase
VVDHTKSEDTELGLFPNPKLDVALEEERLQGLASLLRDGGTNVQVLPEIQTARWKKVIWNMAWNSLTTLTGTDTESWLTSSDLSTPVTHRLMTEAIEVARALGVPGIEYELADQLIAKVKPLGKLYSSMYHDSRAARPMEVEVILGNAVRKGRALGLAIPTLETLYAILLAVDQTLAKARAAK